MSRGGMRWGAGRPGWRVMAEDCIRIDVREWRRRGTLRDGYNGSWRWSRGGEPTGSIGYSVASDSVTLHYSSNGQTIVERVALDRTPCTFGGSRAWFRCPRCRARAAVLYFRVQRFACRRCQGVAYASQSEDVCGRAWRRQAKLEACLGQYWQRPMGMHRRTHERLLEGIFECEETRDDVLAPYLSRFMHLL